MTDGKTKDTGSFSLVTFWVCFSVLLCNLPNVHSQDKHAGPGSHSLAITVNGLDRTYIVHIPATYQPQRPSPLVIMLHGGGGTARAAMRETEWTMKAETDRCHLGVLPEARAVRYRVGLEVCLSLF